MVMQIKLVVIVAVVDNNGNLTQPRSQGLSSPHPRGVNLTLKKGGNPPVVVTYLVWLKEEMWRKRAGNARETRGKRAGKTRGKRAGCFVSVIVSSSIELQPPAKRKRSHFKNRMHLWEFLLELLADDECRSLITWTTKERREFKILNTNEVARLWGLEYDRQNMTYDKLSRSLRTYYRDEIVTKVSHWNAPRDGKEL